MRINLLISVSGQLEVRPENLNPQKP